MLIDKHFPPGHPLHSVINRSTVKVGYRCLPNMGASIARHNSKILRASNGAPKRSPPSCNCQKSKKKDCPLPGACNQEGVIYQATVNNNQGGKETYIGLAEKFKKRVYKHNASMETKNPKTTTTLSAHYWTELEAGREPEVSWKILEKKHTIIQPCDRNLSAVHQRKILHCSKTPIRNPEPEARNFWDLQAQGK